MASADGYLYIYAIDPSEGGGDCTLLKQHKYEKSAKIEETFVQFLRIFFYRLEKIGVASSPGTEITPEHPPSSSPISYAAAVRQPEKSAAESLGSDRGLSRETRHFQDVAPPTWRSVINAVDWLIDDLAQQIDCWLIDWLIENKSNMWIDWLIDRK